MQHAAVISFWFEEIDEKQWWRQDDEFDRIISRRFAGLHYAARQCELYEWRREPAGRLAEIIILDQFSRNLFRGAPESFASDPIALALAQECIALGADGLLAPAQRCCIYMPFMHSESAQIHEVAVQLFTDLGLGSNLDFELKHKKIIDRFGRYPHRNAILGRESTPEEVAFLKTPGSSF